MTIKRETVYRVVNPEGYSYISKAYPYASEDDGEEITEIFLDDATMDEVVAELEQMAESANYHEFIETYGMIAGIVQRVAGKTAATKVMQEVYRAGGFI